MKTSHLIGAISFAVFGSANIVNVEAATKVFPENGKLKWVLNVAHDCEQEICAGLTQKVIGQRSASPSICILDQAAFESMGARFPNWHAEDFHSYLEEIRDSLIINKTSPRV